MRRWLRYVRVAWHLLRQVLTVADRNDELQPTLTLLNPSMKPSQPPPQTWIRPQLGLTMRCTIDEVYDGDTVTVSWKHEARVRLLDCWAPEIRTRDPQEKQRGLAARSFLKTIAEGKPAQVYVPTEHVNKFGDVTSLGRILGEVWLDGDDRPLAARLHQAGHAVNDEQHRINSS